MGPQHDSRALLGLGSPVHAVRHWGTQERATEIIAWQVVTHGH